ncbi:MAG: hypothetical protein HC822_17580 [Oscillochloris sp.]|nr:hypothetical protein [Oscillochloris sp.]
MAFLRNRYFRAYLVIAAGALLFWLRRLTLPTYFELSGIPFDIAVPSNLVSCTNQPTIATCSDAVIVTLTVIGVVITVGWGNAGMLIFAIILALPPLLLYFAGSPILPPLLALAFIPLALAAGLRMLIPPQEPEPSNE